MELTESRHGGVHALGTRREEDLRNQRDAGEERARVPWRQAIRQERLAGAPEPEDTPRAGVGEVQAGGLWMRARRVSPLWCAFRPRRRRLASRRPVMCILWLLAMRLVVVP